MAVGHRLTPWLWGAGFRDLEALQLYTALGFQAKPLTPGCRLPGSGGAEVLRAGAEDQAAREEHGLMHHITEMVQPSVIKP